MEDNFSLLSRRQNSFFVISKFQGTPFSYSTSNLILSLNETHLQNYKIKDKAAFRLHETKIVVIMREKREK